MAISKMMDHWYHLFFFKLDLAGNLLTLRNFGRIFTTFSSGSAKSETAKSKNAKKWERNKMGAQKWKINYAGARKNAL